MKRLTLIAVLSACGEDTRVAPDSATTDAPSAPASCSHGAYLERYIGDVDVTDCGQLAGFEGLSGRDERAATILYNAARECVIGAIATRRSFVVTWHEIGDDSSTTESYVGLFTDGGDTLATLQSGIDKGGDYTGIYRTDCSALRSWQSQCDYELFRGLCLRCDTNGHGDRCVP
jgi:hypothetical protein